nr:serine/threonine-protein phosphatase 7 long form homolog [Ipomoea batatas]
MAQLEPGPVCHSVLTQQKPHRSTKVWKESHRMNEPLRCCRYDSAFWDSKLQSDDRIMTYIRLAGFYGVSRLGSIMLDWPLITAMVDRWRPETHCFQLPFGEVTITLQDVEMLLGLRVDGLPVTNSFPKRTTEECCDTCHDLLGVRPDKESISGASRLVITCLQNPTPLTEHSTDEDTRVIHDISWMARDELEKNTDISEEHQGYIAINETCVEALKLIGKALSNLHYSDLLLITLVFPFKVHSSEATAEPNLTEMTNPSLSLIPISIEADSILEPIRGFANPRAMTDGADHRGARQLPNKFLGFPLDPIPMISNTINLVVVVFHTNGFGSITMGPNARDLVALTNESMSPATGDNENSEKMYRRRGGAKYAEDEQTTTGLAREGAGDTSKWQEIGEGAEL